MSQENNNNDPNSFTNLLSGWGNPYAGSSSNPNPNPNWENPNLFGMSSQEVYEQHQTLRYWQESQRQTTLNSDFQNLQFTQQSQQSQTETYEVPETPTSPPKKGKGRIKRKSKKKTKNQPKKMRKSMQGPTRMNVGPQVKKNYLPRVGWPQVRTTKSVVPKPKIRFGSGL